jgi:cytochrome c553
LYATCAACHGADGRGNEALKAPPLVGQNDWYIVAQLKKFKEGIRGADPQDASGQQMRAMVNVLPDETAVRNVAAYIRTLSQ